MKRLIICIGMLALSAGNAFGWGFGPGGGGGGASSIAQLSDWPAAVSATEVGYLDGVTSAIQTQLGNKQAADADLTTWAGITPGVNVGTALAIAVGSAGAVITNGGALGTPSSGTLTNCTFPTLNQNTTGSAATLTTARNIGDASFNGSANITGDAILDNEDLSPTGGTWDLSALTALTTPAIQAGATTGISITGSNGTVTILGQGDGADEDIKFDLNTTSDVIGVSSTTGATAVNFGTLNLISTGSMSAAIPSVADADAHVVTGAEAYGYMGWATGAGTWTLPAAVAGMNLCVYSTTAAAIVINPDDSDVIVLNGTALSAGDSITSASGAGDFICLVARDGTNWHTLGRSGTWTDTN